LHELLDNRYRIVRPLGEGGMARVYLAHDELLGRDVAVKVLARRLAEDAESVERFRREARSAASLSHPNIVAVHDTGQTEDGDRFIVMEYVPGGTLKDPIREKGPLPPGEAASVALQVARALAAAHARGVIHRDIKPQNVLLTGSGEAKVADFGIARAAGSATLTGTGLGPGTARYVSPEQAKGEPVTPQSDLYSLGVVLYEMLTGELPFDAESPIGVAMKHINEVPRPPKQLLDSVPEWLDELTVRLLAKDPADRPAGAAALVEELESGGREIDGSTSARADAPTAALQCSPGPSEFDGTAPYPPRERAATAVAPPSRERRRPRYSPSLATWTIAAVAMMGVLAVVLSLGGASGALAGLGSVADLLGRDDGDAPGSPGASPGSENPPRDPLETTSEPAPGYNLIEDPSGGLSLEVPVGWTVLTGADSEYPGIQVRNWSSVAGEDLTSSITATPNLGDWHDLDPPAPGAYVVASKTLAQAYTDEELIYSTLYAGQAENCEDGSSKAFQSSPLSGKMQTWQNCRGQDITNYIVAAHPEDRECVAVLQARLTDEADRRAIEHILDTLEVDCGRVS
jgi:serine/threonine protein kinase